MPKYYVRPGGRYGPNKSQYPLDLLTPHRLFRFHSMYDNNTLLNDIYKIVDSYGNLHEPAYMSPVTASAYGLNNGDIVQIFNAQDNTGGGQGHKHADSGSRSVAPEFLVETCRYNESGFA